MYIVFVPFDWTRALLPACFDPFITRRTYACRNYC